MDDKKTEPVFDKLREEAEVLRELEKNPRLYYRYTQMKNDWQQLFLQFLAGKKTLPMTYDTFFKCMFHPDVHADRLERFLSSMLDRKVKIRGILPAEDTLIEGGSMVIMDILVELEDRSIVLVEIQKIPYLFPAERVSCYSADLLVRQYCRVRGKAGRDFDYRDLKKVYTIVIYEKSTQVFHRQDSYVHHGQVRFDTGLELELLQEFYLISLDVFKKKHYHKGRDERDGWLSLLVTETVEEAEANIHMYPWLEEVYREMAVYQNDLEAAADMFFRELREMDRRTELHMIEQQQQEIEANKKVIEANKKVIEKNKKVIEASQKVIEATKKEIAQQQSEIAQKDSEIAQRDSEIAQRDSEIAKLREQLAIMQRNS